MNRINPGDPPRDVVHGMREYRNRNGFLVLELHYTADPKKQSVAWRQQESLAFLPADWSREMELSWMVKAGKPVYTGLLVRDAHVFGPGTLRGDVEPPRNSTLLVGMDTGPTASRMAASFVLVEDTAPRVWVVDEVFVDQATLDEFLDIVEHKLLWWVGQGYKRGFEPVDPTAIENISRIEEQACADVMRLRGFVVVPGERSFTKRRREVETLLVTFPRGVAQYNIHSRCQMHIDGFEGGYHYPTIPASRGGGYGAIPVKNSYSDIHDANQYAVSRRLDVKPIVLKRDNTVANSYAVGNRDGLTADQEAVLARVR